MRTSYIIRLSLALLTALTGFHPADALGQEATRVAALPETDIYALTAHGSVLYAATDQQVYGSHDGGETWYQAAPLPQGTSGLTTLLVHEGILYAGTLESGVLVSQDGGASWQDLSAGLAGFARAISVFTVLGDSLYVGTGGDGVYVLNLQQPSGWVSFNQGFIPHGVTALGTQGNMLVSSAGITGDMYVRSRQAPTWKSVPLNPPNVQLFAYDLVATDTYLIAGTNDGIYRSGPDAEAWHPTSSALPTSSDILTLTTYGARIYAGLRQGNAIYSSDDQGATWTLRNQEPRPIHHLLANQDRLWVGRADGLWYYDLTTTPRLFQASLMGTLQGQPVQRGSVLATLEGNTLRLVGFFMGLTAPWLQVDLYRGDPKTAGEIIRNISLTIPEGGGNRGLIEHDLTLTNAEGQALLDGQLYLHVHTLGSRSEDLSGRMLVLPLEDPSLFETSIRSIRRGTLARRGTVRATLEGHQLRLIGFGTFDKPVLQVSLHRGALGESGELFAILWLGFGIGQETSLGFDHILPLSEAQRQDLLDGRLYLEILTTGPDKVRSHLWSATNQPPAASRITAPADGTTLFIGGTEGNDPVDPATPLTEIIFTPASDPDGNPVASIWQASRTPDFGESVTVTLELGLENTKLPLTVGAAAALFDTTWTGFPVPLPIHQPVTFYHRVITTDGAHYTFGTAASMTLIRGTITDNEPLEGLPDGFVLHGNYPNPFNPATTVSFDLPTNAEIHVEVFNLLGQRVLTVSGGTMTAGATRTVKIDGATLASGSYLYRVIMQSERKLQVATGKMTLIK